MNVLALYEIPGNSDALQAVLADPRARDPAPGDDDRTSGRSRPR